MDDIGKLRQDIDSIDKELVKLFEKRMEAVLKVAEYKKTNGIPILNSSREEEVVRKNIKHLKNENFENAVEDFFNHIMEISRKIQKEMLINYECNKE